MSGSQVWTGTIGALIAKATMKVAKMTICMETGRFGRTWVSWSMRKKVVTSMGVAEAFAHR